MHTPKIRTLRRAMAACDGEAPLAHALGVTVETL
jgi:hypothetical protein